MENVVLDWSELQAYLHEFAVLAGAAALVFTAAQVRQMQRTREAEALLTILQTSFSVLGSNPIATFRRNFQMAQAFSSYEDYLRAEQTEEGAQVGKLIWYYIYMGVTLRQNLLRKDALMRWHAPAIMRTWISVLPIVEGLRKETNSPGFARHFEYLAVEAARWLQRNRVSEQRFFAEVERRAAAFAQRGQPMDARVYGTDRTAAPPD